MRVTKREHVFPENRKHVLAATSISNSCSEYRNCDISERRKKVEKNSTLHVYARGSLQRRVYYTERNYYIQ